MFVLALAIAKSKQQHLQVELLEQNGALIDQAADNVRTLSSLALVLIMLTLFTEFD